MNKKYKLSIETRKKMSNSHKGKKHSQETKNKISKIGKKRGFGKWWKGKKHKEETKQKISLGNKGKKRSQKTRRKMSIIAKKRIGKKSNRWKGGKYKDKDGYILIYSPKHPFSRNGRYVLRSRIVAEKYLGRFLTHEECMHHINEIVDDDKPKNLYLCKNNTEHRKIHKEKPILVSNIF